MTFLAAIGAGDVTGSQITNRVLEDERRKAAESVSEEDLLKPRGKPRSASVAKGVSIMGAGGLLVNLGRCCRPMAGDDIIGYITRGRGVTVHRTDCPNMVEHARERTPDRCLLGHGQKTSSAIWCRLKSSLMTAKACCARSAPSSPKKT